MRDALSLTARKVCTQPECSPTGGQRKCELPIQGATTDVSDLLMGPTTQANKPDQKRTYRVTPPTRDSEVFQIICGNAEQRLPGVRGGTNTEGCEETRGRGDVIGLHITRN